MDFKRMLDYCSALDQNNDRAWFHENHKWYEEARGDYLALLEMLRFTLADCAPELSKDILYMQVKDWVYRVARDMRYHKNRPPYDPAFRAYISRDRKSWLPIGYFLRVSPGSSCFGTGIWCENAAETNRVRDYMVEHFKEFESIRKRNRLHITGDALKKMPRGYPEDLEAAQWVRYKNWSVIVDIPDCDLTCFEDFGQTVCALVRKIEPMRLFLLNAVRSGPAPKQILGDFYRF